MSGPTPQKAELGPPPRWLKCPRRGQVVAGKFIPFKTPLCSLYDGKVPEQYRFPIEMVFSGHKVGLWIDLTNTDRFYFSSDVEKAGARYVKLNCRGHGECPSPEQTAAFVHICRNFFRDHPDEIVAVHCTHGFNRTGFLICSYLIQEQDWSAEAAVNEFSLRRPPGIYKQDYIAELFKRYSDPRDTPLAPALPDWCDDSEPILDDNEAEASQSSSNSSGKNKKKAEFVEGVSDVVVVEDLSKVRRIQRLCQEWCGWNKSGFPGSQPVSMDVQNISFLQQSVYKVSWKADGVRYMMFMDGENEVHMLDRDNNVFHVPTLRFPHRKEPQRCLKQTLVDGELIFDEVDGRKFPRYLIYDVIRFEGQPVGKCDFDTRLLCIRKEIIDPRQKAKEERTIDPRLEPFSVRLKDFWDITTVEKIFSDNFRKNVAHEIDGLIFQPAPDPYEPGRCPRVLKWKPHELNSVDFKLSIVQENKPGMLPEKKGYLYVLHLPQPFATMKVTKELQQYNNKIIECSYNKDRGWQFMRERRDKSFPNAMETAMGVCASIQQPITKDLLINFIKNKAAKPKSHQHDSGQKRHHPDPTIVDATSKRPAFEKTTGKDLMPPPPMPR